MKGEKNLPSLKSAADIARYFEQEPAKVISGRRKRVSESGDGFYPTVHEQRKRLLDKEGEDLPIAELMEGAEVNHYGNMMLDGAADVYGDDLNDSYGEYDNYDPLEGESFSGKW
jgi:hypothetical protein